MFNLKTSKIGRIFNQNIVTFIIGILIIIFLILMIQVLNQSAKEDKRIANTTNEIEDTSAETIVSGSDVSAEKNQENKNAIETFIEYCNGQKIEEAYNMISTDCKEEVYPTMEEFKNNYYDKVFTSSKSYDMQSWISNGNQYTYKVRLLLDMLATGEYDNSKVTEDYYTIIEEDDEIKVSINSYIQKKEIMKSEEKNQKKVNIVEKQVYMDYEIYTIEVENNSNYDVMLDSKETLKNTYLLDEGGVNYSSYIDEIQTEELLIKAGEKKTIHIKFNKMYNPSSKIKAIVFSDIIQDYDIYSAINDKSKYGGRLKMEVEI